MTMNLSSAVFYTNDIEAVIKFYRDVIGFKVEYIQEGRFVSFIFENGAKLGIRQKNPAEAHHEVPGYQTVFISVDDAQKTYDELVAKGVEIYREINTLKGWGTNFQILDADKNKVAFVELEK